MASNAAIIQQLYQHFSERNLEAIKGLFHSDIEWKQMDGFPNGGTYTGFEAILKNVFQGFSDNWTGWKAEVVEYLDAGDSILAVGYYEGTYNQSGKYTKAAFIHRYDLKDGLVIRFSQYTDTRLISEAMEL